MHVPSYITNMLRQKKRYNRANQVPFLSQEVKRESHGWIKIEEKIYSVKI